MSDLKTPWEELGGDFFVRSLQQFARSTERQIAELTYEKTELELKITKLESIISGKDNIIREYLRRIALLEFTLKRERGHGPTSVDPSSIPPTLVEEEPVVSKPTCREILRQYLAEIEELLMPDPREISEEPVPLIRHPAPQVVSSLVQEEESSSESILWELTNTLTVSLTKCRTISPFEEGIFVGSDDGLIKWWGCDVGKLGSPDLKTVTSNLNNVNPNLVLRNPIGSPIVTSIIMDNSRLVSGDSAGNLISYNISGLNKLELFPSTIAIEKSTDQRIKHSAHQGSITTNIQHGNVLITSGCDGLIKFWDCSDGFNLRNTVDSGSHGKVVAAMDNFTKLYMGTMSGHLIAHDIVSGKSTNQFSFLSAVSSIEPLQHGIMLAHLADSSVQLLDLNSGKIVGHIRPESDFIPSCATSFERVLICGSKQGIVKTWDIRTSFDIFMQRMTIHKPDRDEGILNISKWARGIYTAGVDGKIGVLSKL